MIGKVIDVAAIEGADRIRCATVVCGASGKWRGVVGLDVEVGELVTVFLQDAVLPPNERWVFMEKHKWRVRMARFKGVPSECLIVRGAPDLSVGIDLTEALGVKKHEKPIPTSMQGDVVGDFPSFIPKTDEDNFQTVPELVERLAMDPWHAREKADGTSGTAWVDGEGALHVCSRNWELKEFTASGSSNAYWRGARKYGMERLKTGLALQFEVVGPGIQGNAMGLKELEVRAFTLYDFALHCRRPRADLEAACADLGVPLAPVLYAGPKDGVDCTDDRLRSMAEVRYTSGKPGEGIVIRADDSSWSFKVINLLYKD